MRHAIHSLAHNEDKWEAISTRWMTWMRVQPNEMRSKRIHTYSSNFDLIMHVPFAGTQEKRKKIKSRWKICVHCACDGRERDIWRKLKHWLFYTKLTTMPSTNMAASFVLFVSLCMCVPSHRNTRECARLSNLQLVHSELNGYGRSRINDTCTHMAWEKTLTYFSHVVLFPVPSPTSWYTLQPTQCTRRHARSCTRFRFAVESWLGSNRSTSIGSRNGGKLNRLRGYLYTRIRYI